MDTGNKVSWNLVTRYGDRKIEKVMQIVMEGVVVYGGPRTMPGTQGGDIVEGTGKQEMGIFWI